MCARLSAGRVPPDTWTIFQKWRTYSDHDPEAADTAAHQQFLSLWRLSGTLNVELQPGTYAFGRAFEHFVTLEIVRLSDYRRNDYRFSYLRTKDGAEIDLIVECPGDKTALVEIKSTECVDERDVRELWRFLPDFPDAEAFCLSRDRTRKKIGDVLAVPWDEGLVELGL